MGTEEVKRQNDSVLSFYDESVDGVVTIMSEVPGMVECDGVIVALINERKEIIRQLSKALAGQRSLRHKDFKTLITSCCSAQDKCYHEIHKELVNVLKSDKKVVSSVRESLAVYQESLLSDGDARRAELRQYIEKLILRHRDRGKEVQRLLQGYRDEQARIIEQLRTYFDSNKAVRMKDLAGFVQDVEQRQLIYLEELRKRKEYVQQLREENLGRKSEVEQLLDGFRQERRKRHENK